MSRYSGKAICLRPLGVAQHWKWAGSRQAWWARPRWPATQRASERKYEGFMSIFVLDSPRRIGILCVASRGPSRP